MDESLVFNQDLPVKRTIDYHDHLEFTAFEKAGDSEELKDAYIVWKGSMDDYRKAIRDGRELTDPIMFNEVTAQRVMTQRMDPNGYQMLLNQGQELLSDADNLLDRLTAITGGETNRMMNILMLAQVVLIRDRIQGPNQKGLYPVCMDDMLADAVSMRFKDYWFQYVRSYGQRVAVDPLVIIPASDNGCCRNPKCIPFKASEIRWACKKRREAR